MGTPKNLKVVCIFDPDGKLWSTPKGKTSWSSVGAAKNAWSCHNFKRHPKYPRLTTNKKWSEDAKGWDVQVVQEYKLVPNET